MIERVRAVLVTPDGCLLAIRRDRPDRATYWVLPGGHVDPEDQNIEAALSREISEEIADEADITSLLQVLDSGAGDERQYFYLGRISTWDFAAHRAGVQRARTRHLPAGADPADRRRAGSHRPQADRGRRAASRCYRRGPRPVHAIGPAIRPGRASTSWDLKAIALVPRCPFGIGRYISRTNRGVCSGPGARLPVSVRACS